MSVHVLIVAQNGIGIQVTKVVYWGAYPTKKAAQEDIKGFLKPYLENKVIKIKRYKGETSWHIYAYEEKEQRWINLHINTK